MLQYLLRACNALVAVVGIVAAWPLAATAQTKPVADPFERNAAAPFEDTPQPVAPRIDGGEADVLAALEQRLDFDFTEARLIDVAQFIGKSTKINVDLDEGSLEEIAIGLDMPVTFKAKDVRVVSALRLILREMDATYVIRDGALLITTPEEAESGLITRVYPVGHLVKHTDALFVDDASEPTAELIDVIVSTIRPTTWDEVGGPGSVRGFRNTLVVQQTREVHDEVADILAALTEGARIAATGDEPTVPFFPQPREDVEIAKIVKALDQPAELSCIEKPLSDVIDELSKAAGVTMQIDHKALDEVGIGVDTPVTRNIKGVSLRNVLRLMLKQLDLIYVVRDDVILITTPEEAESELITYVFPVADLVQRNEEFDGLRALSNVITSAIRPTTWEEVGGPGAIEPCCGCLVISQTEEVLREIVPLLTGLRKVQALAKATPDRPITEAISLQEIDDPALAKLRAKVDAQIGMAAYERTPLAEIAAALGEASGVPIQFDHRALEEMGIDPQQVVASASFGGESLGQALRRLLRRHDLIWVIRNQVVLITTPDEAAGELETRLYPVSDLVVACERLDDHSSDFTDLLTTIRQTIASNSWEEVGGPGVIIASPVAGTLVVSQTAEPHDQLAALLADMRAKQDKQGASAPASAQEKVVTNKAGERLHLKIYKLTSQKPEDAQAIADTIADLVEPESWKSGEPYYVRGLTGAVVVRHTARTHRTIHTLLTKLAVSPPPAPQGIGGGLNILSGSGLGGESDTGPASEEPAPTPDEEP